MDFHHPVKQFITRATRAVSRTSENRFLPIATGGWNFGRDMVHPVNQTSLLNAYKSWVYVCSSKNAVAVASVPLKLYVAKPKASTKMLFPSRPVTKEFREHLMTRPGIAQHKFVKTADAIEEILEHPILDLFRTVNAFMNRFELFEFTELFLELTGNSYWYLLRNGMGVPEEIWVIPPDRMKVVPSPDKFIAGYIYTTDAGVKVPFSPEEIIHFKFPNPKSLYYGWAPLQAIADAYNINQNIYNYEIALFDNRAIPDIALVAPKDVDVSEEEYTQLMRRWNETYGGAKNGGKTGFLEKGFSVEKLSLAPRELNYMNGRNITREEIAAAYGIPMSKLKAEQIPRANADAGNYQHSKDTVYPRCIRLEEKLNETFVAAFDPRLFLAYDNPVPEDMEFKLKERESNLRTGFTCINEERAKDGLDAVEWGDMPLVTSGTAPLDLTPPQPVPPQLAGGTPPPELPPKKPKKPGEEVLEEEPPEGKVLSGFIKMVRKLVRREMDVIDVTPNLPE